MCIDANTTVRCTGRNSAGQLGQGVASDPNVDPYVAKSVVAQRYHSAPLTGVVSLAAGDFLTCALTSGGKMICWGAVAPNSLNGINTISPTEKGNLSARVTSIVCGWNHSCVLVADGSIECWGSNQFGQLGLGHLAAINTGGPNPPSTSVIGGAVFWK